MTFRNKIRLALCLSPLALVIGVYLVHLCFRSSWIEDADLSNLRLEAKYPTSSVDDLTTDAYYWKWVDIKEELDVFLGEQRPEPYADSKLRNAYAEFSNGSREESVFEALDSIFEKRPHFLELFDRLPECEERGWPYMRFADTETNYLTGDIFDVVQWVILDMHLQARQKKWGVLCHDINRLFTLVSALKRGSLIDSLVGMALFDEIIVSITEIYYVHRVPVTMDGSILAAIEYIERNHFPIEETFRVEFTTMLDAVDLVYDGEVSNAAYYGGVEGGPLMLWAMIGSSKENTKLHFKEIFDYALDGFESGDPEFSFKFKVKMKELEMKFYSPQILFVKDPLGLLMVTMMMPAITGVRESEIKHRFKLSAFPLWLSIRRYQYDHDKAPAFLDELVPQYIATLPTWGEQNEIVYSDIDGAWCLSAAPLEELKDGYGNSIEWNAVIVERPIPAMDR